MHQDHTSPTNLSMLHPMHLREVHTNFPKNSVRLHGSFRMTLKRASKNPEYSRSYLFGDPVSLIDWKAFGRTDQLIIREQRDEASIKTSVIVDLSDTMIWPLSSEGHIPEKIPTKLNIAMRIALHLSHLHLRMGDQIQLWLIYGHQEPTPNLCYQPRSPSDVLSLFNHLVKKDFIRDDLNHWFRSKSYSAKLHDRVYWLSDGLCKGNHQSLTSLGSYGTFFHILSSLETNIKWLDDHCCYFDKNLVKKEFLGSNLKRNHQFQDQLEQLIDSIKKQIVQKKSHYFLATDKTNLGQYLRFIDQIHLPERHHQNRALKDIS